MHKWQSCAQFFLCQKLLCRKYNNQKQIMCTLLNHAAFSASGKCTCNRKHRATLTLKFIYIVYKISLASAMWAAVAQQLRSSEPGLILAVNYISQNCDRKGIWPKMLLCSRKLSLYTQARVQASVMRKYVTLKGLTNQLSLARFINAAIL